MNIFRWGMKHITSFHNMPEVRASRCVRTMSPLAKCQACVDVCPINGIRLSEDGPQIIECTSCGQCVRACSERALVYDDHGMVLNLNKRSQLVIGCARDKSRLAVDVQMPCLQMLRPTDLLIWAHFLDDLWLYVPKNLCAACENDWFPEALQIPLKDSLLSEAARIHIVRDAKLLPRAATAESIDRRTFFKSSMDKILETTIKIGEKELDEQKLYFYRKDNNVIPDRSLLMGLYQSQKIDVEETATLRFSKLSLTHCIFCGACVMMCPHESLFLTTEEDKLLLSYSASLCSGCQLCRDVCPVNGLHLDEYIQVSDLTYPKWKTLAFANKKRCASCNEIYYEYPSNESCCRFCKIK